MGNSTLVGGFNPSEKYESHLGLIIVPNISKKHVPNHQPDGWFKMFESDDIGEDHPDVICEHWRSEGF